VRYSDSDILLGFANKDDSVFEAIYKEYYDMVYRVCFKITKNTQEAEDRTICAFNNLFEAKATFTSVDGIRTYLISFAWKRSLSFWARERRKKEILSEKSATDMYYEAFNDELDYQYLRAMSIIQKAMSCYPTRGVQVLHMIYFEEKTYIQIAEELSVTINTVSNMRKQGLDYLLKRLSK